VDKSRLRTFWIAEDYGQVFILAVCCGLKGRHYTTTVYVIVFILMVMKLLYRVFILFYIQSCAVLLIQNYASFISDKQ